MFYLSQETGAEWWPETSIYRLSLVTLLLLAISLSHLHDVLGIEVSRFVRCCVAGEEDCKICRSQEVQGATWMQTTHLLFPERADCWMAVVQITDEGKQGTYAATGWERAVSTVWKYAVVVFDGDGICQCKSSWQGSDRQKLLHI